MNKPISLARSFLFVPGDRAERFSKAAISGADQMVIDLEDAVAPEAKTAGRASAQAWLAKGQAAVVRVNGSESAWFDDDLAAIAQFSPSVLLAKADLASVDRLTSLYPHLRIIALVESLRGLDEVKELAQRGRVMRIAFGHLDFCAEAGLPEESAALISIRSQLLLASRLAGLPAPIDGVSLSIAQSETVVADCAMAVDLGFAGKLCIHPLQVPIVNKAFTPDESRLAWARGIVEASVQAKGAAVRYEGKMVDRPVFLRAQSILALFEALEAD